MGKNRKPLFQNRGVWEISVAALGAATGIFLAAAHTARAFSKSKPPANSEKMVLSLRPIQNLTIYLPEPLLPSPTPSGPSPFSFGSMLSSQLCAQLRQTHFILNFPKHDEAQVCGSSPETPSATPAPSPQPGGGLKWDGSGLVPAATFSFSTDALALRTGGHGDRMFYGFDERFKTPFNDGLATEADEFPLTLIQFQNWFDRTFQDRGVSPFDSRSGLDLGEGFNLNAVVAQAGLKYESYNSVIRMHVTMDAPLAGLHQMRSVQVTGSGLFLDVVGGYEEFSGAIGVAHSDAMKNAASNAFNALYQVIDDWSKTIPLTAVVYQVDNANQILLNTGGDSNIPVGTRYQVPGKSDVVVEVTQFISGSGSVARLESGQLSDLKKGDNLIEVMPGNATVPGGELNAQLATASQVTELAPVSIKLPKTNLPKANFAAAGIQVQDGFWQSVLDTVTGGPLLPYRIWRYFQYDQDFLGANWQLRGPYGAVDEEGNPVGCQQGNPSEDPQSCYSGKDYSSKDSPSADLPKGADDWSAKLKSELWAKQIGLDSVPDMTAQGPVVAIIDSGVDYNHPAINERLWTNPSPVTDPDGNTDLHGWDFISGDPRPFDDGYHGTEVASMVIGVAPLCQIMPLKVFNPFGITSSAAIYGAFQYAVDHGAKIIVAAWATQKKTKTLDMAVKYAHDHGVVVVVSAGDRGDDLSKAPSYPAALSKTYDNVVSVTGVDSEDQLVKVNSFFANFDPASVTIAAPGQNILTAQPRSHTGRDTSTSLAAGLVAGALARDWAEVGGAGTDLDWIKALKLQSQAVPALANSVSGGLRLRVK